MISDEEYRKFQEKYGGEYCECEYLAIEQGLITLLHAAVTNSDFENVKRAVRDGADINAVDNDGASPIFSAGDINILEFLIENGADVNHKDNDNNTPLHSVSYSDPELSEILLKNGCDVNDVNAFGMTAFDEVCLLRCTETMDVFKRYNAENGFWVNKLPPLHRAVFKDDYEWTKKLLEQGADPDIRDEEGRAPLHRAASEKVARLLLENGANVDACCSEGTPLYVLIHEFMCEPETEKIAELLINSGANVNYRHTDGWGLLHWIEDSFKITKLLVEKGADIEARNEHGYSALHSAVEDGDPEVIKFLLEKSANVHARNIEQETVMHMLACGAGIEVAELLIEAGAEINATDKDGNTALHRLASIDNNELVEYLMAKGAETDLRNNKGKTPLDVAIERDCEDVVRLLSS